MTTTATTVTTVLSTTTSVANTSVSPLLSSNTTILPQNTTAITTTPPETTAVIDQFVTPPIEDYEFTTAEPIVLETKAYWERTAITSGVTTGQNQTGHFKIFEKISKMNVKNFAGQ